MIEIKANDIKILDFILNEIIFKRSVTISDLIEHKLISTDLKVDFDKRKSENPEKEFKRLAHILQEYNVCNILETQDGITLIANNLSQSFHNNGGFKKVFNAQELSNEKEHIELEKSKIDLRLKKLQLKTFWVLFGIAIMGFGFSVYNFTGSLKISKNTIQHQERIKEMELELTKLRTSFLIQKKVDSLNKSQFYKIK